MLEHDPAERSGGEQQFLRSEERSDPRQVVGADAQVGRRVLPGPTSDAFWERIVSEVKLGPGTWLGAPAVSAFEFAEKLSRLPQ